MITIQQIKAIIIPLISGKANNPITQVMPSGSGVIGNATNVFYYNNASTTASVTLTLPAMPIDGQALEIHFLSAVTALSIVANTGQTISHQAAPTNAVAGKHYSFIYIAANQTWLAKH